MSTSEVLVYGPWRDAVMTQAGVGINPKLIEAMAILRRIEWSGDAVSFTCPVCRRHKVQGHETWCELDAALQQHEQEPRDA